MDCGGLRVVRVISKVDLCTLSFETWSHFDRKSKSSDFESIKVREIQSPPSTCVTAAAPSAEVGQLAIIVQ